MHVAILGTYPPTQCGIATFTADVEAALRLHGTDVTVVPVSPDPDDDPARISRDVPESYAAAAQRVNASDCDVALIQHEFGIFGGTAGEHVLRFVEALTIPYVVTLHTVLPRYDDDQLRVIRQLCRNAATVVVFTSSARRLMLDQSIVPARYLQVVAHGAPAELYKDVDAKAARDRLRLPASAPVMSTFGLLSQGKGIELAIQAMALLNTEHPDLRYVIAGTTHPEVVRREGERYRMCLKALADDLGVGDRVIFLDRFLDLHELADLLGVSDVVCTPYRGGDQTVSGVLTFALAAGCPIVSTPYRYARDVLADGAGILVDFDDEEAFADALHTLLDEQAGARARTAAREASESMEWSKVGESLQAVLAAAVRLPMVELPSVARVPALTTAPLHPGTSHLRLLCDDTAVLQHAHHNVPRTEDGYCVDDAGRLLPIIDRLGVETGEHVWYVAVGRVLAFLRAAAANGQGRMRNFMAWDRQWTDEPYIGDHVGRAIWGLGELVAANGPFAEQACELLDTIAPAIESDWPARTLAYAGLGLVAAVPADPSRAEDLDRLLPVLRDWKAPDDPAWDWFEDRLTYDNARIPEVLIRAGHCVDDDELVRNGSAMLHWLESVSRRGRHYRFPGCRGLSDAKAVNWSGDEQPLEAAAMADAHAAWYQVSGDPASLSAIERAWAWFLGENRLGEPLVDIESGAGFDGLGTRAVNRNRGAESTIAVHRCAMAYAAVASMTGSSRNGVSRISVHA
jgi:glycosyltransferase involved in cell wall biosynthesis